MKIFFIKLIIAVAFLFFPASFTHAANLGLFGFNLNMDIHQTLNKAIDDGFRIKVYGSNLDPDFASQMLRLSYQYEISNIDNPRKEFENEHSFYNIITNIGEIKYAKGFSVYNFLDESGNKIGSFIYDDNVKFIRKNKYGLNIIPVKLYKENLTIDMIFYSINNTDKYMPLFFGISFFKLESVSAAIYKLNARFGQFSNINNKNISARYWTKDGTSVANYFGLNDRFVFYNIDNVKKFNNFEYAILERIKEEEKSDDHDQIKYSLHKLHESM